MALHETRRQQFLSEALYEKMTALLERWFAADEINIQYDKEHPTESPSSLGSYCSNLWHQWMLEYTAGKPIKELAPQFVNVVDAFEAKHKAEFAFRVELGKEPDTFEVNPNFAVEVSPIDTYVPCEYSEWLQLMGTAILLRDETSAQRIAQWSESNVNYDGLLDQFYLRYLDDVDPVGELTHPKTFDLLFDTFTSTAPFPQMRLTQFMKGWYKFQKQAPWYDGHLGSSPYFGYWSFEAGAVAFLLDIDDSDIDHMAYPHDLVAYARKLRAENRYTSPRQELKQLKLRAGDTCPKDGWWWTPAAGKAGPQPFKTGDTLPKLESDRGNTTWYWQSSSHLMVKAASKAFSPKVRSTLTKIQALPVDSLAVTSNSLELHYHYDDLRPVENALFKIQFADGSIRKGQLDTNGYARLERGPEGEYSVEFHAGYDCTLVYVLWHQWMMEFTAGKPIEELAPKFVKVVDAFETKQKAEFAYRVELAKEPDTFETNPDFAVETSPIDTDIPWEYSDWLQLMGTAILLRDETSAQRIAQWSESNVNYDGLLDQFYLRYLEGVDPVGELAHPQTFDPLFDTFFADTPEEAQTLLKQFMAGWHQFQSQPPSCHDEHRYWSFEAGAVAFLLDIDDSDIDPMSYPHNLVAYARKLRAENRYTSPRQELKQLKLRAGDTCPKDGWWWSLAGGCWPQQFKAGDKLPQLESDWGDSLWYWQP